MSSGKDDIHLRDAYRTVTPSGEDEGPIMNRKDAFWDGRRRVIADNTGANSPGRPSSAKAIAGRCVQDVL